MNMKMNVKIKDKGERQVEFFLREKIKQREIEMAQDKKRINEIYSKYNLPYIEER